MPRSFSSSNKYENTCTYTCLYYVQFYVKMFLCIDVNAQFIDGRLELLNSGEGFNDVFEEEINMGEYAGEDI